MITTFCSLLFLTSSNAYNILVYSPAYANSHSYYMGNLADILTDAGHNVTLLIPVVDDARRNLTVVRRTSDVVFVDQDEIAEKNMIRREDEFATLWTHVDIPEEFQQNIFALHKNFIETCANLFRNQRVFAEMKNRNFDVVLSEPLSLCGVGFAHRLGVRKIIQTSSCIYFDHMVRYLGEPTEHSYVPTLFSLVGDQMNLMERYANFKTNHYMVKSFDWLFEEEEKIYTDNHRFSLPSWRDLLASTSLHFTNSNPNLDFPRPTIQKTVLIGGVSVNMDHIRSQKLGDEWNQVLNMREKTMLISFGSMVRSETMPLEFRENMLRVIQSFPDVTFIWKYESDETKWAEHVPNVHFSKWVPQTALLNDQRVTAFVTHGGLGSVNELSYSGKPAVMIPIAWDQPRNANMYAKLGTAITIRKHDLDKFDLLRSAIQSILYDESYTENARRIAEILENQPVKPRDLVVKYTEFVARFGPFPNMDPYVRHLNFIQRTGLDVLVIFYFSYIVVFICVLLGLRLVLSSLEVNLAKKKLD